MELGRFAPPGAYYVWQFARNPIYEDKWDPDG